MFKSTIVAMCPDLVRLLESVWISVMYPIGIPSRNISLIFDVTIWSPNFCLPIFVSEIIKINLTGFVHWFSNFHLQYTDRKWKDSLHWHCCCHQWWNGLLHNLGPTCVTIPASPPSASTFIPTEIPSLLPRSIRNTENQFPASFSDHNLPQLSHSLHRSDPSDTNFFRLSSSSWFNWTWFRLACASASCSRNCSFSVSRLSWTADDFWHRQRNSQFVYTFLHRSDHRTSCRWYRTGSDAFKLHPMITAQSKVIISSTYLLEICLFFFLLILCLCYFKILVRML